ncbi:MAG: ABC-F family ATP-binding cassette domain-containing protein [Candidatus Cloacimonetes bacterium]|nr:ABC-F family ATP-binding cassette domain-containing protein [Candidatus Cloacimonadota bacterium]
MKDITLNAVKKSFGGYDVLKNLSFELIHGEKIGLIGRNGSGKTTIFRLITGSEEQDAGSISIAHGASIGYIEQIPVYTDGTQVIDVLKQSCQHIFDLRRELRELEQKISKTKDLSAQQKLMSKYEKKQLRFEHLEGYDIDVKLEIVCTGLKITEEMLNRDYNSLSGGEKTRVMLGQIFLNHPDVLLLDEPTNHLDIESIEWLEDFISQYKGSAIIVAHDRYFLDATVTKIVELEDGKAKTYKGNYSKYIELRDEEIRRQFASYKNQQKKIEAMEEAIKRFRDWGTRKDNPDMFKKAMNMERRLQRIERIEKPTEAKKMGLNLSSTERSGNDVIKLHDVSKTYETQKVLHDLELSVYYQDHICILGKNGTGKSTIFKIVMNEIQPDKGEVRLGSRLNIGYLEQEVQFDDDNEPILDAYRRMFPMHEDKARTALARFLFFGDDVFKKLGNLSGGEKVRFQLCVLMKRNPNLLLLDEPTNHLDIDSMEMLEEALSEYRGTILFISHDRYFINKIAHKVLELEDHTLHEYLGNYDFYKQKKTENSSTFHPEPVMQKKPDSQLDHESRRKAANEEKSRIRRLNEIEKQVEIIEEKTAQIEKDIEVFGRDYEKLLELYKERNELQKSLDALLKEWAELDARQQAN